MRSLLLLLLLLLHGVLWGHRLLCLKSLARGYLASEVLRCPCTLLGHGLILQLGLCRR